MMIDPTDPYGDRIDELIAEMRARDAAELDEVIAEIRAQDAETNELLAKMIADAISDTDQLLLEVLAADGYPVLSSTERRRLEAVRRRFLGASGADDRPGESGKDVPQKG